MRIKIIALACVASLTLSLSGCGVVKTTGKVASLPFKGVYKATELTGKGVYHTGRIAGTGVYETGKFAGTTVYKTGKGVYYVGRVPVQITDKALDTTTKVLTVTTQVVDLGGKVMTLQRQIHASELDAELAGIRGAANVIRVFVDAAI